jgi:hypothetical protein
MIFGLWWLILATPASAGFLVDFDYTPEGVALNHLDVLTDQYAAWGVHFTALEDASLVDSRLFAWGAELSGNNVWTNWDPDNPFAAADILRITFDLPVSQVTWKTTAFGDASVTFRAYDTDGKLLETTQQWGDALTLTQFSASGISRIDALQPEDWWAWAMDDLEFSLVPEPSTVTLWALGGLSLGIAALRRRRRS